MPTAPALPAQVAELALACRQRGIGDILISISHCRTYATAYALALGLPSRAAAAVKESGAE